MIRVLNLEICGFRGIRARIKLDFAAGFTVLTGANGSGKSSIVDAMEFALSGSISKYEEGSGEKGEKSSAYEWWRGNKPALDNYVRVQLADSTGLLITITRRPDGISIEPDISILDVLCDRDLNPESTVEELCRTSIVRDEFIAKNSVDLPETDRFNFVRAAVGGASTAEMDAKLSESARLLKSRHELAQREYERLRRQVQERAEQLASARGQAAHLDSSIEGESKLRKILNLTSVSIEDLLSASDRETRRLRNQAALLADISSRASLLAERRRAVEALESVTRMADLKKQVEELSTAHAAINAALAESQEALKVIQTSQKFISNLAQLHRAGDELGRQSDHCPLCGSAISEVDFRKHLDAIAAEVASQGSQITRAVEKQSQLRTQEQAVRNQLELAEVSRDRAQAEFDTARRQIESVQLEMEHLSPEYGRFSIADLQIELQRTGDQLSAIDQYRRTLAASDQTERIIDLERDLETAKAAAISAEKQIAKISRIGDQIKEAMASLKRIAAEAVEERLAAIKPLFNELYLRLRPHIDWKTVDYAVRGDVRKFLSLRVDDDLNLKFIFSSGQRRATGLAFLISVALSRPWSRLITLVLDDPIQHVDDFRAVHLVETLAAIRSMNYQLICAVEDPALADLLCRRLRSSYLEGGTLIRMKYVSGEGTTIDYVREITPFELVMLQSVS
jgi:chromosome segregation protein